ncbi:response regulator [Synechocystis sp. LKSZ1]|uniref:response regulator n=1 Tax=Synechocystis sp. LKSZ1 TaxID=3144951 RepID=UPI00336BC1AA
MRILLIEDDDVLTRILLNSLKAQHYVVDSVADGQLGWEYSQSASYDLLLMDVGLPRLDGISLCRQLRDKGSTTPILLMTAKHDSTERVRGLDAGADDYLNKPFELAELHARLRALLRRGEVAPLSLITLGDLSLDPSLGQATYQGLVLKLTPKEYSLLELFMRNPLRLFSRAKLVEHLWSLDDPPLEDSVKAHVKGLRQKLKKVGITDAIENVYGMGYRFQWQAPRAPSSSPDPFPSLAPTLEQGLDELWQQSQGLMAERLAALERAVDVSIQSKLTPDIQRQAQQAAHKLAGVLGMFGREAGTELAQQLEQLLAQDSWPATDQSRFQAMVTQLRKLLALAPPPGIVTSSLPLAEAHSAGPIPLLLIDHDRDLFLALQTLTPSEQGRWHRVKTLTLGDDWLKAYPAGIIVFNQMAYGEVERQANLALATEIAQRYPQSSSLLLWSDPPLTARRMIAQAQALLSEPIPAQELWELILQVWRTSCPKAPHIVVVDDDPLVLGSLHTWLEPQGLQVTSVDDPRRLWEILPVTTPDLLILDVEMPHLSGIELCQMLRLEPRWHHLPILFLTAHQGQQSNQAAFTVGADDYLTKPITEEELLLRVKNRLQRSRFSLRTGFFLEGRSRRTHNREGLEGGHGV